MSIHGIHYSGFIITIMMLLTTRGENSIKISQAIDAIKSIFPQRTPDANITQHIY